MAYCNSCGRTTKTKGKHCLDCDYCNSCCLCAEPTFFHSKLQFHEPKRGQKRVNKTSRYISAEIEVAGISRRNMLLARVVKAWGGSIVYDGTLPVGGFEINTAPAGGDLYINQVSDICDALAAAGGRINEKCGLHVHIDARDFNYADIARLVKIYAAIEPALLQMVPENRHSNKFSIKCGDKLEKIIKTSDSSHISLKEKIITAIYNEPDSISHRGDKRGAGHGTGRYYALNLHSWFFRGTIECRLFNGTMDKIEIIDWGMLWAKILDFALNSSDDDVLKVMNKDDSYNSLIHIVKNDELIRAFIDARCSLHGKTLTKTRMEEVWNTLSGQI